MTNARLAPRQTQSHYRPEIDGLRAFAVAAVIINHFRKSILPSGYLGVDIFFVISGYVITLSLLNQQPRIFGHFIASFYARRIRRLLPALIAFVIISSLLICLVNPNPTESLRTGAASIFGVSNIYLFRLSTNYFSESSELNIFTHTWSLGVEEQFYFVYPILFWLARKYNGDRQRFLSQLSIIIGSLSLASLVLFIVLSRENQPGAYFLMPSRLWEMGSGCLLALQEAKTPRGETRKPVVSANLALLLVIVMLLLPYKYSAATTPLMIISTVMLIRALKPNTTIYTMFSQQKVLAIGIMSYSLYLWHWAVLCMSRWTIGIEWWSIPVQIMLMLIITLASYRFIECPARYSSNQYSDSSIIGWGALSCFTTTIVISLGLNQLKHGLFQLASPPSSLNPLYVGEPYVLEKPKINTATCSNPEMDKLEQAIQACTLIPAERRNTFYFIGDSQSNHLKAMAGRLNQQIGIGSQLLAVSSMPFPTGYYWISSRGELSQANKDANVQQKLANHALQKVKPGDVIVLSGRYIAYFSDYKIPIHQRDTEKQRYGIDGRVISNQEALDDWAKRLEAFAQQAAEKNAKVIIILPFPEFPYSGPQCISYFARINPSDVCTQPKQEIIRRRIKFVSAVEKVATKLSNLYLFDPMPPLCPEPNFCTTTDADGKLLYYDATHLSNYGSEFLATGFSEFLRKNKLI